MATKWTVPFVENLILNLKNEPIDTTKIKIGGIKTSEMTSSLKRALQTNIPNDVKELIIKAIEEARLREVRRKNVSEFRKSIPKR